MDGPLEIRPETPGDFDAIHALTERAFEKRSVADLNDRLRENGKVALSLVAADGEMVVGHVMFSPVESNGRGVALGPIAVLPERQGEGIGRRLVETGLAAIRAQGFDFVMLLGSPGLYPRFGFVPGSRFGLRSDYDVPDDEFMAFELRPGGLTGVSGTARFAPEFRQV